MNGTTTVVRRSRFSGKFHVPTGEHGALCGAKPLDIFGWTVRGDRQDFEKVCPERLCLRCRKAEASARSSA